MSEFSNYLENKILNVTLDTDGTQTASITAEVPKLALYTGDPGEDGTANEVTGAAWPAYARQSMSFTTATTGSSTTDALITFAANNGAGDVVVTHVGIFDTTGNFLYHTPLDASKTISPTDVISFASGSITVTVS